MSGNKAINDATDSLAGTLFQLCVALDESFALDKGEKLWVEKFGDVTTPDAQIETKLYADNLTDSHENLWKTLKNWCDGSFDHSPYSRLVLLTTQTIGPQSRLHNWNEPDTDRIKLLDAIWKDSELKFATSHRKNFQGKPSSALVLQRIVMSAGNRSKLVAVVAKTRISSQFDGVMDLWEKMKHVRCKGVLDAKREAFLADAFGYIASPSAMQDGWEISYEGFDAKVSSLYQVYGRGTRNFPKKYHVPASSIAKGEFDLFVEKTFVKKIAEIGFAKSIISHAISEYLYAHDTVLKDFKDYELPSGAYEGYALDLMTTHVTNHRKAKRNLGTDQVIAAQNFYDELTGDSVQSFPGFDVTPMGFRNGVYHMLADDLDEFVWRLW